MATNAGNKILLVEDDQNFGDVLRSYLEMHDFDVTLATDGAAGWDTFRKGGKFDLCIFDVMMPKKDGFTLAKEVREKDKEVPIIFLTAKNQKDDVLTGFKMGADDYITKPFETEVLLMRVQAVLKRSAPKPDPYDDVTDFEIGKYKFNFPHRVLRIDDIEVPEEYKLSPKEADLLKLFCANLNHIVPRSTALSKIWGQDDYFTARSMDVFVTKLRKYLKSDPNIEISNIHGSGFQLVVKGAPQQA